MAFGMNHTQIIGRLGADPDAKFTKTGKPVATFRVAVNARGGGGETTEWFSVVTWEKLAETCHQYLHKGDPVYVAGRLQSRRYTDRDGVERTAIALVARDLVMLGGKTDGAARHGSALAPADDDPNDVPF